MNDKPISNDTSDTGRWTKAMIEIETEGEVPPELDAKAAAIRRALVTLQRTMDVTKEYAVV